MNKKKIGLHTPIWLKNNAIGSGITKHKIEENQIQVHKNDNNIKYINTTPGRILLNDVITKNLNL